MSLIGGKYLPERRSQCGVLRRCLIFLIDEYLHGE